MSRELYAAVALTISTCSGETSPAARSTAPVGAPKGNADGGSSEADASTETSRDAGSPGPLFAFIGCKTGKIRVYKVQPAGDWTFLEESNGGQNPSFLAFDPLRRRVVAVDEVDAGVVRSFAFAPESGALTELSSKPSGGAAPTHLSLDPSGTWVMVANYTSGSASIFPLDAAGTLGSASDSKASGAKSHWAGTNPSGTHVFVPALGANAVAQYVLGTNGKLADNGAVSLPAKAGPRHLAFHPSEKWAYVVNELAASVTTFDFDKTTGKLSAPRTVSALPDGQNAQNVTGAEIFVHPSGKHVYASTREYDSIARFNVNASNGSLERIANLPTGGHRPRSFAMDPEGTLLFAANEGVDQVVGFTIDAGSGALTSFGKVADVEGPTYVGLARMP